MLEQGDGQPVLKIDLAGLARGPAPERRAAMVGQPLQVDGVLQPFDQPRLAAAGAAAEHHHGQVAQVVFEAVEQEAAHRLVAAHHQRHMHAGLVQPGLGGAAAQAATEAIQIAVRVGAVPLPPGVQAGALFAAADQFVAEIDGRLLALLLITNPHPVPLVIVEQRQVAGGGKGALGEFHRRAHVQ